MNEQETLIELMKASQEETNSLLEALVLQGKRSGSREAIEALILQNKRGNEAVLAQLKKVAVVDQDGDFKTLDTSGLEFQVEKMGKELRDNLGELKKKYSERITKNTKGIKDTKNDISKLDKSFLQYTKKSKEISKKISGIITILGATNEKVNSNSKKDRDFDKKIKEGIAKLKKEISEFTEGEIDKRYRTITSGAKQELSIEGNELTISEGNTITLPGGGSGGGTWGSITGTLSAQTDLQSALNAKANTSSLATVATSGDYTDLSNKPTIPGAAPVDSVNGETGVVVLDADDIDDTSTSHKFATGAELALIATNAGDISTIQGEQTTQDAAIALNTAKNTYPSVDSTKVGHISVTQAVDLDQMETDIAALANGMVYKGDWDASSGIFPGGGSAQTGWFYYVSVGGTVDSVVFTAGDNVVATTDNASTTTYASNWSKHDQTDAVQSVVGLTGSITKSALLTALNVEDGADVTDSTNVNAAGAVMESDYTPAYSILVQQSGTGSPSALQVGTNTLIGRVSGGGSNIDDLSASDVRSLLNVEDGADVTDEANVSVTASVVANTAKVTNATHSGDVSGATVLTINSNVVENSKLAVMDENTIKGRITAGSGDPEDLTATQVRSMINVEDGADVTDATNVASALTLTGDVTSTGFATTISTGAVDIAMLSATGTPSATTYLRGDNTWATITGGSGDVSGPASSVDNSIARFDGTGGKTLQGYTSGAPTISDTGLVTLNNDLDVNGVITATQATGAKFSVVGNTSSGLDANIPSFELRNDNTSGFAIGKFKIGTGYLGGLGELWLQVNPAETALRVVSNHDFFIWTNNTKRMTVKANGTINIASLPTSATGLSSGDLWNSSGDVRVA